MVTLGPTQSLGRRNAAPKALAPEPSRPRVLDNLVTTNKALAKQVVDDVEHVVQHPWTALKNMVSDMVFPLLHPVEAVHGMVDGVRADPLGGVVDAVGNASGTAFVGTMVVAGLAVIAAPFTGGASLAIAGGAMALGTPLGYVSLGSDAAGVLVHEARGATARSSGDAWTEGTMVAGYAEDAALNLGTWAVGDAIQDRFFPTGDAAPRIEGTMGELVNNSLGLAGVYAPPPVPKMTVVPKVARMGEASHGDRLILGQSPDRQQTPSS